MNVPDENIIFSQREQLREWRIPFRQIGYELAKQGTQDSDLLPLLLSLKQPTFFTRDFDFFTPEFCHPRYCLVWLNVRPNEVALFLRRFLGHRAFCTHEQRLGKVVRVHRAGLEYWQRGQAEPREINWI
jgi:hypothetical protein